MPFRVSSDPDREAIILEFQDVVTAGDLRDTLREFLVAHAQTGWCRVLSDCRTQRGGHTALDLTEIWTVFADAAAFRDRLRQAVVLPTSAVDVGPLLWIELCRSRGLDVRGFESVDEAWRFLLAAEGPY